MNTQIVDGKEYVVETIAGKGVCLVPKFPDLELKVGSYISLDNGRQIGRVFYLSNNMSDSFFIMEIKNNPHVWWGYKRTTVELLARDLEIERNRYVIKVITRQEAAELLK